MLLEKDNFGKGCFWKRTLSEKDAIGKECIKKNLGIKGKKIGE
jgi:hypothetical protein